MIRKLRDRLIVGAGLPPSLLSSPPRAGRLPGAGMIPGMKADAQRFLERWAEVPRGTAAAQVLREMGLSEYFAKARRDRRGARSRRM